ncbi:MAG: hypothetical protein V3T77_02290 [Planctomycetota bacterium]
MKVPAILMTLCAMCWTGSALGDVTLEVQPVQADVTLEAPTLLPKGLPLRVRVMDEQGNGMPNVPLFLTLYPASELAETVPLGTTDHRGDFRWIPETPGLVVVQAGEDDYPLVQQQFSILYPSFPLSGLTIAVLVGILYFGVGGWLVGSLVFGSRSPKSS